MFRFKQKFKKITPTSFALFGLLLFVLALLFVAAPKSALAFDADGVVGAATAGLKDFFTFGTGLMLWVIGGLAALFLTTNILQWIVNNQTTFVNFDSSGFVQHGLTVTQNLADMLFLLIFVIVAFGIIFRLEKFGSTKNLAWVVLWAILTRFGPLVVKVMTDIGNLAINTIMAGNENLLGETTNNLIWSALISSAATAVTLAGLMVAYAIPVINLGTIGLTVLDISATALYVIGISNGASAYLAEQTLYLFSNFVVKGIFQVFASFTLSGIYLTYIVLFVSRIFMLQILAVLSPLAIMARALKVTEHWFFEWWKSLVSWTFVGVYTLFFLVLGLGSANFIFPKNSNINAGYKVDKLEGLHLDENMFYYLFLIVYLSLVQTMANKDKVMGAMFRSAFVGLGSAAFTNVVSPTAKGIQNKAIDRYSIAKGRLDAGTGGIMDKVALRSSGAIANLADAKNISGLGSIFSGDASRASKAAGTVSDTWGGLDKIMKIDNKQIDARVAELDKNPELSLSRAKERATKKYKDIALGKAKPLNELEMRSLLGRYYGKKEYADDLKAITQSEKYGDMATKVLKDMDKQKKFTDAQTRSAVASGVFTLGQAKDLLIKSDRNNKYQHKINTLVGDGKEWKTSGDDLLAWSLTYKDASSNKTTMEDISDDMFEVTDDKDKNTANEEKLTALLSGSSIGILGKARDVDPARYQRLTGIIKNLKGEKLKNFAKANPQILQQIASDPKERKNLPAELLGEDRKRDEIIAAIEEMSGIKKS